MQVGASANQKEFKFKNVITSLTGPNPTVVFYQNTKRVI